MINSADTGSVSYTHLDVYKRQYHHTGKHNVNDLFNTYEAESKEKVKS